MFLGYRLRELRAERNISQGKLGEMLGVTKVSISCYEKGTRVPSMDILVKILNAFNVPADYLLGREINAVCEDDVDGVILKLSTDDIEIIREVRGNPSLYNCVAADPKRFFANAYKNKVKSEKK